MIKLVDRIIELALEEDIKSGDITTDAIIPDDALGQADFLVKEDGVIAGLEVVERIFRIFDENLSFQKYFEDGAAVSKGTKVASVTGNISSILKTERTALNFLQRMSGIATLTSKYVKEVSGTGVKILDTRKTAPGLRITDKMAVKLGGAENHRIGLFDMYLIKDNHIKAAGSIKKAAELVRAHQSQEESAYKIEIEVSSPDQIEEAVSAGADVIMLDNFTPAMMREAVKQINRRALVEASGGITLETIREYAETGIDYISTGALTHSAKALDISMKITSSDA
ncbi:MAG: carboxylating nicotinate-nucleotide diphosphorylase [Ignavibacteriaceae bacterium]|nr:carboxylating nicotinate-nucleotide diphosphorylase [Ignavibacteriaceae bacterium]NUM70206.1 carboxylating nicotinate-nucleotide diphosphorylase [Ignavibacteriaceae bacterium]